jgi:hypothetical protein
VVDVLLVVFEELELLSREFVRLERHLESVGWLRGTLEFGMFTLMHSGDEVEGVFLERFFSRED